MVFNLLQEIGDDDFFHQTSHMDSFNEKEFLRVITIPQSIFSSKINSPSPNPSSSSIQGNFGTAIDDDPCGLPFDETSLDGHGTLLNSCTSSNSIISLDNTNIVEPIYPKHDYVFVSSKKRLGNRISIEPREQQRPKKVRNSCETEDHIMAERKRRQELTGNIIELSAIIPELKKVSLC